MLGRRTTQMSPSTHTIEHFALLLFLWSHLPLSHAFHIVHVGPVRSRSRRCAAQRVFTLADKCMSPTRKTRRRHFSPTNVCQCVQRLIRDSVSPITPLDTHQSYDNDASRITQTVFRILHGANCECGSEVNLTALLAQWPNFKGERIARAFPG